MSHIDELRDAIHKLHGGKATHRESVPVKEVFGLWKCFTWKATPRRIRPMRGCTIQATRISQRNTLPCSTFRPWYPL
jgi:hypothetical protein